MHQSRTQTDSPQRCSADLVAAAFEVLLRQITRHHLKNLLAVVLRNRLQNSVARANVMHQEVSVRMKCDRAECGRNRERSTIDFRSSWSGRHVLGVASLAPDLLEQLQASVRRSGARDLSIARGRFRSSHKPGEVVNVGEAVWPRGVVRLRSGVTELGDFVRLQAVCDAHLIQVCVAGERQQARVLVFPAESAYAHLPRRFHDGYTENLAANFPARRFALLLGKVDERLVCNSLDEPISQQVERKTKRSDRLRLWNSFLNFGAGKSRIRADRAIVHKRSPGDHFGAMRDGNFRVAKAAVRSLMADAQFSHL